MRGCAARQDCRVVVLGDSRVGKSAIINKFRAGRAEVGTSGPVVTSAVLAGARVKFTIYEAAENDPALFREADVFMLCFKVTEMRSLVSAVRGWAGEVRAAAPATPLLLVGCQADLRGDRAVLAGLARQGRSPVSKDQAASFARQLGAAGYVESSVRNNSAATQAIFQLAARVSVGESIAGPASTSTPSNSLERDGESAEQFWEQFQSPALQRGTAVFQRTASLSSSLNSTRSSISLPPLPASPARSRRNSLSLRARPTQPEKLVKIRCQRLNADKIYEEVEIEVPAPIFETLQACNEPSIEKKRKESLGSKLKHLFLRD